MMFDELPNVIIHVADNIEPVNYNNYMNFCSQQSGNSRSQIAEFL